MPSNRRASATVATSRPIAREAEARFPSGRGVAGCILQWSGRLPVAGRFGEFAWTIDPGRGSSLVAMNYLALVVQPSVPNRTVAEMVACAKANLGTLSFGSNGEGGFPHRSFKLPRV